MYKFVCNVKKEEYDDFVKNYSMASFMQDYNWGNVKNNWNCYRCGVYSNNKLVSVTLILYKKIIKRFNIFYIPRGFLIDYTNKELLKFMTLKVKELASRYNAFLVKIDPNFCISDDLLNSNFEIAHNYSNNYKLKHNNLIQLGYKYNGIKENMHDNFQPQYNMVVPLIDNENNILSIDEFKSRFKSKFEYYLDDYLVNRGVTFKISNNIQDIPDFVRLLNCTEDRNDIKLRDEKYFERILNNYKENAFMIFGIVDLKKYLKYLKNNNIENKDDEEIIKVKELLQNQTKIKLSCGLVILPSNKKGIRTSEYLYAGNDLNLKKIRISQGLVFEILKISIKNKCHYCNLGGVDGSLNDNLSKFKSKFLPQLFIFTGEYDLVINKFVYKLYNITLKSLKKIKSLKK